MSSALNESEQKMEQTIHHLIYGEKYSEAAEKTEGLPESEKQKAIFLFYRAMISYENGDDLKCIQFLSEFLNKEPNHEKRDYSLFTIAISLINLGLEEEALTILKTLPSDYPDLSKELAQTLKTVEKKRQAREYSSSLKFEYSDKQ